jgi:hypothetical protein
VRHPRLHRFLTNALLGCFFANRRWYRRWQGGHWEQWYIEVCWSDLWLDFQECTRVTGERPGTGRGTPICEHHPWDTPRGSTPG